jgi:hypothetical protein
MNFPFHIVGSEVPDRALQDVVGSFRGSKAPDGIVTISTDGLSALALFPPTYLRNDGAPNDCAADNDRRTKIRAGPGRFRSIWRKNAKPQRTEAISSASVAAKDSLGIYSRRLSFEAAASATAGAPPNAFLSA